MAVKTIAVLCAQAVLIQVAFSQCTSRAAVDATGYPGPYGRVGANFASPAFGYNGAPLAYDGLNWAGRGVAYDGIYPAMEFSPTTGGGLPVTSRSPISPTGISVVSDNFYEGPVTVVGELPFLSAVSLDGVLATAGAGAINYGCGNGVTAMISEGIAPNVAPSAYGPASYGPAAPGFGPTGFGGIGYGGANLAQVGPGAYGFGGNGRGLLY